MHPPALRTVRKTALVALLAMLMHALLPLAMTLPRANGVMMTLCSVQGSRQVFVAFGELPAPARHDQAARPMCPLCVAGAQLALQPVVVAPPALRSDLREARALRQPSSAATRARRGPAQPRAPPFLSA